MKDKILNETTQFCNECPSKECCSEDDCVLWRIEQIILKGEKSENNKRKNE